MPYIYVPFWIEQDILDGLKSGEYERKGGVVRHKDDKRIVCWLKQEGDIPGDGHISHTLFKIIAGAADVESLSDEELMELGAFINGDDNLRSFNFYKGSKSAVESITDKYNRLMDEGKSDEAKTYANEKRQSLVNIFAKTYIPNLKHQIELNKIHMIEDEKNGLIQFVENID